MASPPHADCPWMGESGHGKCWFALAALPPYPSRLRGLRPAALRPTLSVWVAFFRVVSVHTIGPGGFFFNCLFFFVIMRPQPKGLIMHPLTPERAIASDRPRPEAGSSMGETVSTRHCEERQRRSNPWKPLRLLRSARNDLQGLSSGATDPDEGRDDR